MAEQALPVFEPKPGVVYKYDYKKIFKDIAKGHLDEKKTYRTLILTDLWFVVYFVLGMPNANHQFIVNCCKEVEDGPQDATLDIWAREHLKCISADTEILMADGSSVIAEHIKAGDRIVSLDANGKSRIAVVVAKEDNGVRDVVDIETTDGRRIAVTPNHRLLGFNKWVEASEFRPGDYIGIPRRCARDVKETMSVDEVKFISYMLAGGGCSGGNCDFTNTGAEIVEDFKGVCDRLGFKISRVAKGITYCLVNGGRKFLRDYGIYGCKSTNKRVPSKLFSQPDSHLIEFVRCFWACDGTVNLHSKQASVTLANPKLIEDIRTILLFFGIHSTVSYFDNGKAGAWALNVNEIDSLNKLLEIGIGLQAKHDKLKALCEEKAESVSQGDEIPIGWTALLNRKPSARFYRNSGLPRPSHKSSGTSRRKVADYAVIDSNKKLKQIVNSDIRWVKVKAIGTPRKAQTYDIQVEDTQVFIANGFVSHNTSIITVGESIQQILKCPEKTHCLFSYVKPIAKKFLFSIKETLAKNKALIKLFPDVLYENPEKEAQLWSLDEGIIVKRRTNRKEPTICASGLTEGMVTGMHFEYRKYDDIVTEDIGQSFDVMEDVKLKFDSSQNLGIDGGTHRVTGTFYHYEDPLVYIKKKMDVVDPSKPAYLLRLKPATEDGTASGKPVFLSQLRLNSLKLTKTFKCQQLLNPAPEGTKKLNKNFVKIVKPEDLPRILHKIQIVDPAGKKGTGDPWASVVVGVSPDPKDVRASNLYILDLVLLQTQHTQTINAIIQMYRNNGRVLKLGIEQVGQSTAEVHISSELKNLGINLTEENGRLVIFTPAGRNKEHRIEQGLSWHLDNGKIFVSDAIERRFIDAFLSEIDNFPFSNNDHIVDTLSYFILDLLPKCRFRSEDRIVVIDDIPFGAYT